MKRVASATEAVVPIPLVVVPVNVHFALVVVPIEDRVAYVQSIAHATTLRILSELNFIWHRNALIPCTKYLHFLLKFLHAPLYLNP